MSLSLADIDRSKLTPMMQQYLEQKSLWPDCLLFFRLGDFYELFFDDAVTVSRELELMLTGRDCGFSERAPMCGVPYHAADSYIARLVGRGFKVAICEQMEDPALAKGIVRRAVIRVLTPGTQTGGAGYDETRNHYILSVYAEGGYYGLAAADLGTGIFEATELIVGRPHHRLIDEICRYGPAEIVCNAAFLEDAARELLDSRLTVTLTPRPAEAFSREAARQTLALEPTGADLKILAASALLAYLTDTQKTAIGHIEPLRFYTIETAMGIDANARRNLELTETYRERARKGSLLWAVDRTRTAAGARLLRRWIEQPLIDLPEIRERQEAVAELKDRFIVRQELRESMQGLHDLERLGGKVALGSANGRDLLALAATLERLPAIQAILAPLQADMARSLAERISPETGLAELLVSAIHPEAPLSVKEGNLIRDGYDAEIDRLREAARNGKDWIVSLEAREREQSGIRSMKIGYNRVFGFYFDVTKANLAQVPAHFVRKQTLANGERYVTDELKSMEDTILGAEQKLLQLEYALFCEIRERILAHIPALQQTARALAALDTLAGLAELADRENYCRPELDLTGNLSIQAGRHPVLEKTMRAGEFVPNDIEMNLDERRFMILTGPNMAGKSTYMRQVALIVVLAQVGSFVPAASARIGIVDKLFTRIGASDDLASGQSTFMVEMNEVSQILREATPRSLLILDEIGRGTSTYDGLAIAWSVIEHIADRGCLGARSLFATHYHELTDLAGVMHGVFNSHVAVEETDNRVVFLHRIEPEGTDDSYGIEVARLAGVPKTVISRAQELLQQLEKERGGRERLKIRRHARPMDGQLDLFSAVLASADQDSLISRLTETDTARLTPLDALNLLHDLVRQARQLNGRQSADRGHQSADRQAGLSSEGRYPI